MEEEEVEEKESIKVILIGDTGVGKTNLINVASGRKFDENERSTLTASYVKVEVNIEGEKYIISLWDTIGQEKLRALSKLFFKNSKIVIYVYDITSKVTFDGLSLWDKDVKDAIGDDVIKAVVGNKQDLYLEEEVNEDEANDYANSLNAKFRLTSAKKEPEGFSLFLEELLKDYIDLYKIKDEKKEKKEKKEKSIVIKNKKKSKKDDGEENRHWC